LVGAWLALAALPAAWGADPLTYRVRLEGSIGKDIESTLSASSDLVTLRKTASVGPVGLMLRSRGDTVRLKQVLESFGYYDSAVTATIDGDPLTSADLADKLTALPAGKDASVVVSFTPGPLYHLGKISIDGDLPDAMRGMLTLRTGQPAIAADVLGAGTRLLTALQDNGYAFATVDVGSDAELLPDSHELDVPVHVHTGKVARFGAISVTGLQRTRLPAVLSRLKLHAGEQYSARALDQARRNLLAMGVFGSVDVNVAKVADANGAVPVTFLVTERKRHDVVLNAAYSSDLGGSAGVTWTDHNLVGSAEELVLAASVININGSATNGIGYDTSAKFIVPEFLHPAQTLQVSLDAIQQSLLAYDQKAETAGVTLTRNLSQFWSASVGFTATVDSIVQPQELIVPDLNKSNFFYTLFALPLSLRYDSTGLSSPLLDPTHGIRAALTIAPTQSLGPPDATYVISQFRASAYLDLHDLSWTAPGRTVIAVRGLYGYAQGADVIDLPPDQRFYAGGSGTIRGYVFQSVGAQFSKFCGSPGGPVPVPPGATLEVATAFWQFCGAPMPVGAKPFGSNFSVNTAVGGVAVEAASVELRQRVGTHWGFAVFADGGSINQTAHPFSGQYQFGVGTGARYYTPIGAIRFDIAFPWTLPPNEIGSRARGLQVYIGLGQAF
jgi:translocation and assembly module TamA